MGEEDFYALLAEQERQRQRGIAQSYFNASPSIDKLYNAAIAFWKSLPIVGVSAADMNPYMQTGVAPDAGGYIKPLSTFQKLSAAGKIQNAKSLAVRRAKADARRAAEKKAAQEELQRVGNKAAIVRNTNENYVYNEAERAAAIDFLKENPSMKNSINTNVIDKYSSEDYMYPWNTRFAKLLPTRKSLKETRFDLDRTLKNIR